MFTPPTFWSGFWEAQEHHLSHPVLDIHRNFALLTLWIAILSLPFLLATYKSRPKIFTGLFLVVLTLIVGSVSITAYNGGRMVYEYGIGMEAEK